MTDPSDDQRRADWRAGPDPDRPPWAREPDDADTPGGTPGADTPGPDDAAGADDARDPGGAGPRRDAPADDADAPDPAAQAAANRAVEALARAGGPRPPRRTGVFVDADDLRTHVGGLLRAILGGYQVDAFGNFTFTHEGARVFVTVGPSPIGPQVGVFSVTNLDVDLTPPLSQFLLTTNHTLGFGAFSYDPDNRAVWLRHTLLGTMLDGPELQSAVASVATTAARVDTHISERFGGRTFGDSPDDVARGVEPPAVNQDPSPPPNASGYL